MAESTRLAKLPGYDTAPDVYETPELTDDASTSTPASPNSHSDTETPESDDDNAESRDGASFGGVVSKRRLFPERARSRFQAVGKRVETKGLDLSDRVDGRRRGYKVRRRREDEEDGAAVEESLEARLARLRREVEECRALAEQELTDTEVKQGSISSDVDGLGRILAGLEITAGERHREHQSVPSEETKGTRAPKTDAGLRHDEHFEGEQMVGRIAAFDSRLSSLERALGIASLDVTSDGSFTSPILPTLDLLDQQMSVLASSTSLASLDAASGRVKKLAQEAEQLAQLQATGDESANEDESEVEGGSTALSRDDVMKLNALYGLLPTLQSLSPTVPALLERLRSLRALHTGAANAANELDTVERKQAEMDAEIKSWKEGLMRVEKVVKDADEANGRNGKVVQGWVKDLEAKVKALNEQ